MALTDFKIKHEKPREKPFRLTDGHGLSLLVNPNGSKYFQLRYRHPVTRKAQLMQLGVYPTLTLLEARDMAHTARKLLRSKQDPMDEKRRLKQEALKESFNTFEQAGEAWYRYSEYKWAAATREKISWLLHAKLYPRIGKRSIVSITAKDLLQVLQRIQTDTGTETGKRALRVAGQVWRYAASSLGVVQSDITQELKGQLKSTPTTHRAAIVEPESFGRLLVDMDGYSGNPVIKAALQLSPLFFCRPGELRQLEWDDVKWDRQQIEIPGARMKMGNDHVIPVSSQAMSILRALHRHTGHRKYVFFICIRQREQRPLSENGVRVALNELGYEKRMTPHGFRASARTMLEEQLGYSIDLIEHQSGRRVRDPLGRAYNRTQHLDARKDMMQRWADYLDELKARAIEVCTTVSACNVYESKLSSTNAVATEPADASRQVREHTVAYFPFVGVVAGREEWLACQEKKQAHDRGSDQSPQFAEQVIRFESAVLERLAEKARKKLQHEQVQRASPGNESVVRFPFASTNPASKYINNTKVWRTIPTRALLYA